jgi:hypothetical protein
VKAWIYEIINEIRDAMMTSYTTIKYKIKINKLINEISTTKY